MVPQIAQALIAHILAADEEIRAAGMDDVEFTQMEDETESTAEEVRRAYARGDSLPIDAALTDWLNRLGIDATPAPVEFQQLRRQDSTCYRPRSRSAWRTANWGSQKTPCCT